MLLSYTEARYWEARVWATFGKDNTCSVESCQLVPSFQELTFIYNQHGSPCRDSINYGVYLTPLLTNLAYQTYIAWGICAVCID